MTAPEGSGTYHPGMPTYLGMPAFPAAAAVAVADSQLRANLAHATRTIRAKRARAVAELADWEELRAAGKTIKDHTLANLDHYLLRLEENVIGPAVTCTGRRTPPRRTRSWPVSSGRRARTAWSR